MTVRVRAPLDPCLSVRQDRPARRQPQEEELMYATVRHYEDVKDPAEAGKRVNEGFVPLIKDIEGFVTYYWVDAGDGVMVSCSVFEDQAGEEESNNRAREWVKENMAELLPNPPAISAGHVVAHEDRV
jgi:hypothetical protein